MKWQLLEYKEKKYRLLAILFLLDITSVTLINTFLPTPNKVFKPFTMKFIGFESINSKNKICIPSSFCNISFLKIRQ